MRIAITREVSPNLDYCELTHKNPEAIEIPLARAQHHEYEKALAELGCQIHHLPALPDMPDSVFVEDTCLVLDEIAIITRPGAPSRRPETASVEQAMRAWRSLHTITEPGTLDGGDILCLGKELYVGVSARTNEAGIAQLWRHVGPLGYRVTPVRIDKCLHLKSAVTQVAEHTLLINPDWVDPTVFGDVRSIPIDPTEPFAANALLVNHSIIYSNAFPCTRKRLEEAGLVIRPVNMSELAKAEGGVTCCSLIFNSFPTIKN